LIHLPACHTTARRITIMAELLTPVSSSRPSLPSSSVNARAASSAALEAVGTRPRRAQRRPTKQASYELTNHAKAYLEGGQCMQHRVSNLTKLIYLQMPADTTSFTASSPRAPAFRHPRSPTLASSHRRHTSPLLPRLSPTPSLPLKRNRKTLRKAPMPRYDICNACIRPSMAPHTP
jgi:hypothetical protein